MDVPVGTHDHHTDRPARRRTATRAAAGTTAALLTIGLGLAGTPAANAATGDESRAAARFVSGSLGGQDLDTVAAVKGVEAVNKGSKTPVTATNDLDVTVLDTIPVKVPGGITVPLGDVVRLGAVNQYAQAADAGVSRAAAGAVSDAGVVDTTGGTAFPADATVSLKPLLQAPLTSVVDDVSLQLQAITGVAALDAAKDKAPATTCTDLSAPTNCRDYQVAGGRLAMSAPALKSLVAALTGANGVVGKLDGTVNALTGTNGALTTALQSGRTSLLGSSALSSLLKTLLPSDFSGGTGLSVAVDSDLDGAVNKVLDTKLSDGVVTIDLKAGMITVDLDKLLRASTGHGLNDLAPNTEVLS
ncbi:MAG: choice-of-anchor G family protein, partial [Nocardioidaceae bacterium]